MLRVGVLSLSLKMVSDCHRNSGSRGTSHRLKASKTQRPLPKGFLRRHRLESPDVHVVTRLAASGCIRDRICCRVPQPISVQRARVHRAQRAGRKAYRGGEGLIRIRDMLQDPAAVLALRWSAYPVAEFYLGDSRSASEG